MLAGAPRPPAPEPQKLQDPHAALFAEERFPSATTCASCHGDIYREWSVSPHAYAQLSPVFNAMQAKIGKLTNGTNGDFCIRCHTPVGMNLGEPTFQSNLDRNPDVPGRSHLRRLSPAEPGAGKDQRPAAPRRGGPPRAGVRPQRERRARRGHRPRRPAPATRPRASGTRRARRGPPVLRAVAPRALRLLSRRQLPGRVPVGGSLQRVQALAGGRAGHNLPGLPHGQGAGRRLRLRRRTGRARGRPADAPAQTDEPHVRRPPTTRSSIPAYFRTTPKPGSWPRSGSG